MVQWHLKSKRKPTGGLYRKLHKKKKYQRGRDYLPVRIKETKIKRKGTKGGSEKIFLLSANYANINVQGQTKKAKIFSVLENPANPQLVRRNIIMKGVVIETEIGKARVTSKPGQNGVVNAVLIEKVEKSTE